MQLGNVLESLTQVTFDFNSQEDFVLLTVLSTFSRDKPNVYPSFVIGICEKQASSSFEDRVLDQKFTINSLADPV